MRLEVPNLGFVGVSACLGRTTVRRDGQASTTGGCHLTVNILNMQTYGDGTPPWYDVFQVWTMEITNVYSTSIYLVARTQYVCSGLQHTHAS